jgi:hypothetical protein
MPCTNAHRPHISDDELPFSALVARPVGKAEIRSTPAAQEALLKEWTKLRQAKCWDESKVQEWSKVAADARKNNTTMHVGLIFEICVEKGSELAPNDPNRKYKGRVVFQGNNVKDENWNTALFQELGSSPATMEAGKACDAFGLAAGHTVGQADAYIHAQLKGVPTWVRLPRERWPKEWAGVRDPVCPLALALYGHPDSGGFWEQYCNDHLLSQGFTPIRSWRSCFFHKQLQLFLVVYVDDFKMAGPTANLQKGWELVRKRIRIEPPTPLGKYLGCSHVVSDRVFDPSLPEHLMFQWPIPIPVKNTNKDAPDVTTRGDSVAASAPPGSKVVGGKSSILSQRNNVKGRAHVRCLEYDMSEFLRSCVEPYKELAPRPITLRKVETLYFGKNEFL